MKQLKWWGVLLIVAAAALVAPTVFAGAPTGAGPLDPMRVTGSWQTIAPNSSWWFYFDYTGDRSKIEATLEDYGIGNVQLAVYTPDQAKAWLNDPTTAPVGIGTQPSASSAMSIYDLTWRGAFNFPGRFFAVVTNNNSAPVAFRLNVSGDSVLLFPPPTPTPFPTPLLVTPISTTTLTGKLVFQDASGGIIYTVNGDGTKLTPVSRGMDPDWSPDGTQIALARWESANSGIFVVNADGSNEQVLLGDLRQPLSPRWSSDGQKIVFTRQQGGASRDSQFCFGNRCFVSIASPHWKIGVIDVATGALTEPPCSNFCFSPTWYTDNHTFAYADANFGIMISDATSPTPPWNVFGQNPDVQSATWSPDGSKIAFMVRQHDHWEIMVMNADGSNVTRVTWPDPLAFRPTNNVAPAWSPDSRQVLFLSDRNSKWEFFVVNADGSHLQQALKNVSDAITLRYNFSNERVIDWTR